MVPRKRTRNFLSGLACYRKIVFALLGTSRNNIMLSDTYKLFSSSHLGITFDPEIFRAQSLFSADRDFPRSSCRSRRSIDPQRQILLVPNALQNGSARQRLSWATNGEPWRIPLPVFATLGLHAVRSAHSSRLTKAGRRTGKLRLSGPAGDPRQTFHRIQSWIAA